MWKKWAIGVAVLLLIVAGTGVALIGPRNVIGMIRYDKRQQGRLKVGDRAPDVTLVGLDGQSNVRIADRIGRRPLVLVFGSYT